MKKLSILAAMIIVAFTAVAFAQTVPADKMKIDLKTAWSVEGSQKAVFFNHEQHIKGLKCDSCHKKPEGGDTFKPAGDIKGNTDKNVAHNFCWTCHKTQDPDPVRKVCTKCHTGK